MVRLVALLLLLGALCSAAIGYTAKGTCTVTTGDCTISSVTIAAGASLIVGCSQDDGTTTSVVWNSITLTDDIDTDPSGRPSTSISSAHNVSGATSDIVMTGGAMTDKSCAAAEVTGLATSSTFDKSATATGSSTTPSSGNTATTTQADEILFGFVGFQTGPVGGTWSGSFTDSQNTGSGGIYISQGYRIVSATGAYAAAKTGTVNDGWGATIATYKMAAAGGAVVKDVIMRGVIVAPR